MNLFNTLSNQLEDVKKKDVISIYSCGPTVYNHVHIGNMFAFIAADTLRRSLEVNGYNTKHVMNITDVDDKTIRDSKLQYPDQEPSQALETLTRKYEDIFISDIKDVGIDTEAITFIRATDSIKEMLELIRSLLENGFAYTAEDGVYFSIEDYRKAGKKYGQLVEITSESTGSSRVNNDEYDKDSAHDFALWKKTKEGEPSWSFEIDGEDFSGRPGWHIECSAMSKKALGQPFDIHTGGVDLIFPHHENEIAQSTAVGDTSYAEFFVHNEHVMVDGKKMSKSLDNFYTIDDISEKGYKPHAFRLLALQSHYRTRANFSWENLEAAQNRLHNLYKFAELRWQPTDSSVSTEEIESAKKEIIAAMGDDMNTPRALEVLSGVVASVSDNGVPESALESFVQLLETIDNSLGLSILNHTPDITEEEKVLINKRSQARAANDYETSDKIRDQLKEQSIDILDHSSGARWHRAY